jgi:glutathione S-transferase
VRYLDRRLEGTSLTPPSLHDQARMEQWISVEGSYFSPPAMRAIMQLFYAKATGGTPDAEVVAKGKADAGKALDVLDQALQGEWLAGSFSLAEVCYAPYFQYLMDFGLGDVVTSRPHVAAWWNRIAARPAWQKAIGKA